MERIALTTWVTHWKTTRRYKPGSAGMLHSRRCDSLVRECAYVTLDDGSEHVLFSHEYQAQPEETCLEPCLAQS